MTATPQDAQHSQNPAPPDHATESGGRGKMLRWFLIICVIFLVIGVFNLLQRHSEHKVLAEQTDRLAVPTVAVIHPAAEDSASTLTLPGNITSFVNSPIYARTSGYLKKWYVDIGGKVKAGQLLAEIDSPEVDAQLVQARADLTTAEANVKLAQITSTRYQGLIQSDSVSQQEVDNYTGDLAAKKAMVQSAEANVKRLQELQSFEKVYAPFSGVITQRLVDIGNLINSGNGGNNVKEMFDLAQPDPLRVYVSVPQTYAPSMHEGLKACLDLSEFPGRKFCGQVARTANSVDPGTRTLLTEVDVPNPQGTLLQGEYAQVNFDAKLNGKRLTLPINALLFRPEGTMAAVLGSDSHIVLKKLTIGRDFGNSVEVLDGLSADDSVVVNPPDSLEQGEKVALVTPNSSTANASGQ